MYQKTVLPNKIRVVSEEIPYVKSVAIGVWVGTGSRFEREDNHGTSHFIEHMMFKGTENRSAKEIAETVDAVGGQLNAFTAKEYTCYYIKVLDSHREMAMDVLSDMLLGSKFDAEDIELERQVVLEEIHMYEDAPDELVHDIFLDSVWPGHQLGRNILGTKKSIEGLDKKKILEYCRDFYTADNIVIAAAGNIEHAELVKLCEKYFGSLGGQKKEMLLAPPQLLPARNFSFKDTEQVHICMGTLGLPQEHPDIYNLHLLNNIFGGGVSSRLFQSIREERGLAYSVYSYHSSYKDAGLFSIYAGTRPANAPEVVSLILENIRELKKSQISPEELRRAKEQLKGSVLLGLESSGSRMSRIGKNEISLEKYIPLEEIVEKIEAVSLAGIAEMINKLFVPEMLSFTSLGILKEEDLPGL
ncbi:MAG: insulinase family protein, partial [Sporomusaceae bacterium]|nr:insulinase family protein [Sporomusaceae bacterium]